MKKIIGLIGLAVVLCCGSASACDVKIIDVQHRQISDIDTSYKVVRSSNGSDDWAKNNRLNRSNRLIEKSN